MNSTPDYVFGKRLVGLTVQSRRTDAGIFGWIKFENLMLHQRDEGFYMDQSTGYVKQPGDSPIMEDLVNLLLYSYLIPHDERQVLSAGARDDIGFYIKALSPDETETYREEVGTLAAVTLMEHNKAIRFV